MSEKLNPPRRKTPIRKSVQTAIVAEPQANQSVLPYDEYLLERARTQWMFGDWKSLSELNHEVFHHHPERAKLMLLAAAGRLQTGDIYEARRLIRLANDWGVSKKLLTQILVASAYNSLGRVASVAGQESIAQGYYERSISIGVPGGDIRFLSHVRAQIQKEDIRRLSLLMRDGQRVGNKIFPLDNLYLKIEHLTGLLLHGGHSLVIEGEQVFNGKDSFLPGKVALCLAYHVTENIADKKLTEQRCSLFSLIGEQIDNHAHDTWGIYFYLKALKLLEQAGVLNYCFSKEKLNELKICLDWRGFVDDSNYRLRNLPNNFYGVAYAIAALRFGFGWDDYTPCQRLLEKMLEHYRKCSGRFGFADETNGQGRYDRYSFLLIGEIAHHLREGGQKLSVELTEWLRRACEVVLNNLNPEGNGFPYGRSIGAYGDTAYIEIISAGAWHGVLSSTEMKVAHAFSCKATKKFLDFWWDDARGCVNLWWDGRRTDSYRGKHRVLGESISLLHQHLYVHQLWIDLGFLSPLSDEEFLAWIGQRPSYSLTRFAEQKYSYALLTVRDGQRRFNLPLVNGDEYHSKNFYYPIPFSNGLIQGVADTDFPQLVPCFELAEGGKLMPLAWFGSVVFTENAKGAVISWEQRLLDILGERRPGKSESLKIKTSYKFEPGNITRIDRVTPNQPVALNGVEMFFATFSTNPIREGMALKFSEGGVFEFEVSGFDEIVFENILDEKLASPEGKMATLVKALIQPRVIEEPLILGFTIRYR